VYKTAPKDVQRYIHNTVLSSDKNKKKVLRQADSLLSCLLKLITNLFTLFLRESIFSLLFKISRKDTSAFVQNIGYRFALGLLFQQNVSVPQNTLKVWSVTELILGHGGLGEESNYNYSKLKRKGKERESNASYFTINTSVCVR
jgi:hypothetical protein